ncbi:uncharacterized protein BDZ99DRAFT_506055 [Mytilinidion resinicola]|uniref:Isomerase YbhE n=1 Tax=Mytilinidion resinicola TaxID=574789 RepID=A0A6A6Z1A9_9PEZI|nr:uncharacterized protein BDZ99DRAFT_506055 [Mytilinidion resinicola]KAF2814588.1 hypothetical protein BDZ99DRAFT_506055 [Mytilinidion resinicola]
MPMDPSNPPKSKAIYFLSNEASNAVVALKINHDGTLSPGSTTLTGGAGGSGTNGNMTAGPDALFSQGSLTVSGNFLFAVNPGSNTLSAFAISPHDPTQLTPLGAPVSTIGDFPISVAAHPRHPTVCVATSGARAGIACGTYSPHGLSPLDHLREFALNQTTPPAGPLTTVSQTFFSADGSQLLTTVKGAPPLNTTGYVSAFPVRAADGKVGAHDTRSSPPGTAVLFGVAKIPGTNDVLMADASFGAVITTTDAAGVTSIVDGDEKLVVQGQQATCWATFSEASGTGFVTDVLVNRLVEVTKQGKLGRVFESGNGNDGYIDLVAVGGFVYALAPGAETHVTVFDVASGGSIGEVENFRVEGVGKAAQGMAVSW